MKVAQIVTYVASDGSFGGPVAVAVAQAVELARQGHDVEILAGWDGDATLEAPGVTVRLFPVKRVAPAGFSGLVAPAMMNYLRANWRTFDAFHIHLARDLITLPAATFLSSTRTATVVIQSHGMIVEDGRLKARLLDAIAVRRVLRRAVAVIAYPGVDGRELESVARGPVAIEHLVNGVTEAVRHAESARSNEVLFMARLHPRKRVLAFAEMARLLVAAGDVTTTFSVVGPDEGDLPALKAFIADHGLGDQMRYEGALPYSAVRERLQKATVYVLPSVDEPFPVTVLDAMAVGTACVITDTCGIAPYFLMHNAGHVTDGAPESLADTVRQLTTDELNRKHVVANADELIKNIFSIDAVARKLVGIYARGN